jgi:hypothetical protein
LLVSERHDRSLFTTVCTIAFRSEPDSRSGKLETEALVRLAGHPPPVSLIPAPVPVSPPVGLPLGVASDTAWEPACVPLGAEWALLMHTDGLIEGRGTIHGEPLWEEGLLEMLRQERDTDLEVLPARLVERAQELNGGPLSDDVAILLLSPDTAPQDAPQATAGTLPGEGT